MMLEERDCEENFTCDPSEPVDSAESFVDNVIQPDHYEVDASEDSVRLDSSADDSDIETLPIAVAFGSNRGVSEEPAGPSFYVDETKGGDEDDSNDELSEAAESEDSSDTGSASDSDEDSREDPRVFATPLLSEVELPEKEVKRKRIRKPKCSVEEQVRPNIP